MVDIERVEALVGATGHIVRFGCAGRHDAHCHEQADTTALNPIFDGEMRGGSDSDMSYRGSLVFNMPLQDDKLALRLVGYNDTTAALSTTSTDTRRTESVLNGPGSYPADSGTLDNSRIRRKRLERRGHYRWARQSALEHE